MTFRAWILMLILVCMHSKVAAGEVDKTAYEEVLNRLLAGIPRKEASARPNDASLSPEDLLLRARLRFELRNDALAAINDSGRAISETTSTLTLGQAHLFRAELYRYTGNYESAIADFASAKQSQSGPDAVAGEMITALTSGHWQSGFDDAAALIAANGRVHPEYYLVSARCAWGLQNQALDKSRSLIVVTAYENAAVGSPTTSVLLEHAEYEASRVPPNLDNAIDLLERARTQITASGTAFPPEFHLRLAQLKRFAGATDWRTEMISVTAELRELMSNYPRRNVLYAYLSLAYLNLGDEFAANSVAKDGFEQYFEADTSLDTCQMIGLLVSKSDLGFLLVSPSGFEALPCY